MPNLQTEDYQNLLSLIEGRTPLWDTSSLQRCVQEGLVTPTGRFFTIAGDRKAKILQAYVSQLRVGVPLNKRTVKRELIEEEGWVRCSFQNDHLFFNGSAVFKGRPPDSIFTSASRANFEDHQDFKHELYGYINSDSYRKLIPYAVQIDDLGHRELICFKSIIKNDCFRIQSQYYDFATNWWWTDVSFWFRLGGDVIAVKAGKRTTGFKNGIVGFIKPFKLDRPFPPFTNGHSE